jgi:hypothetical protein
LATFITLPPLHLVTLSESALVAPEEFAIVPAQLSSKHRVLEALPVDDGRLNRNVRLALALVALGWVAVFGIARWLTPDPRGMGTHEQLGLPPCTFQKITGTPCPSCGMTTSFCHLAHGDLAKSLEANPVGTLLAAAAILVIPWLAISAIWGRRFGVKSYEVWLTRGVLLLLILLMVNWTIVVGNFWITRL